MAASNTAAEIRLTILSFANTCGTQSHHFRTKPERAFKDERHHRPLSADGSFPNPGSVAYCRQAKLRIHPRGDKVNEDSFGGRPVLSRDLHAGLRPREGSPSSYRIK